MLDHLDPGGAEYVDEPGNGGHHASGGSARRPVSAPGAAKDLSAGMAKIVRDQCAVGNGFIRAELADVLGNYRGRPDRVGDEGTSELSGPAA
ncbi:hypothetical protein GCM10017556_29540 [Micromonospora sagamiensis]|nr:hypothetical protein GCM10017556_29540 [Micromonospora sagamiensis]